MIARIEGILETYKKLGKTDQAALREVIVLLKKKRKYDNIITILELLIKVAGLGVLLEK